jgi:hypothetical protein
LAQTFNAKITASLILHLDSAVSEKEKEITRLHHEHWVQAVAVICWLIFSPPIIPMRGFERPPSLKLSKNWIGASAAKDYNPNTQINVNMKALIVVEARRDNPLPISA